MCLLKKQSQTARKVSQCSERYFFMSMPNQNKHDYAVYCAFRVVYADGSNINANDKTHENNECHGVEH